MNAPAKETTRDRLAGLGAGVSETFSDLRQLFLPLPDLSLAQGVPEVAQRIARLQFRRVVTGGGHNFAAALAGCLLWCFGLWMVAPGLPVAAWALCNLLRLGATRLLTARFAKSNPPDGALRRWEVAMGATVVLAGATWGAAAFLVPAPLDIHAPYAAIGLLLVMAGSLNLFVNYRPSISWFAAPCAVLASLALVGSGAVLNMLMGAGFFMVASLLIRLARIQNHLITQSMRHAEERLALLQELETRRQEAQHANQAKTRFLAAASHDLRQPIHSIALLTNVLARRPGSDAAVLGEITASVEVMDDMLNALLEVSRLDAGALPLNLAPVPLAPLLERLGLQFQAQAAERGIRLEVRGGDWRVFSDPHQLHRILANLVSNAVRFTPSGGVLVRCRRRGGQVWVQVWDSGIGIARADRARVFEEFAQVAGPVGPRPGIGLGLSIVLRLSKRLGCAVHLRSRPGRGSVFSIAVPLHAEPGAKAAGAPASPAALEELLAGQLVLLIDDDALARGGMRALLEACQCHVLACGSTREALAEVERSLRTPDLVISDYRLGEGEHGLDAIAAVRAAADEAVPAVLITAELQVPREAAARLGVEVLRKPLRPAELASALQRLPGGRGDSHG